MNFNGQTTICTINAAKSGNLDVSIGTNSQRWSKVRYIEFSDDNEERLVGEYRDRSSASYVSIKKDGDAFLVDMVEQSDNADRYFQVPATLLSNGDLSLTIPSSDTYNFNAGKKVVMRAVYNQLHFLEIPTTLFASSDTLQMEKVSKYPFTPTNSIQGGWTNSLLKSSGYMSSIKFLQDGTFFDTGLEGQLEYGQYSINGTNVTFHKTCKAPETKEFSFDGHWLLLNSSTYNPSFNGVTYNHVPGMDAFGEHNSVISQVMFEHAMDRYKVANAPRLIPHPQISGVYLFGDQIRYDATYASFTLMPDGTGRLFSGSIDHFEDYYTEEWLGSQTTGGIFGLKYFVLLEKEKEYLVYYYDGAFIGDYDNVHTIGEVEGNIKDVKVAEIFHGRTALCHDYIDDDSSVGIIMPLKK
jgi:hypothetical protein